MIKLFKLAIIIILLAFITNLTNLIAQTTTDEPIKVGVILPLSGDFAAFGNLVKTGINLAVDPKIKLFYEDEGCDPKQALSAYKKLSEIDHIKYFLGPSCGSPQKVLAPLLANDDKIIMLTSSATSELFQLSKGHIFEAQYSIEEESKFIAEQFNSKGYKNAVMLYQDNEFSRAHEASFVKYFKGNLKASVRFPSFESSYIKSAVLKFKSLDFDVLYVPDVSPFLLGLMTQMANLGLKSKPVYSVYSVQMQDVLDVEGQFANGLIYSYPLIKNKNAISYFPFLGAKMLFSAISACGNTSSCTANYLKKNYLFDQNNILKTPLVLKIIGKGKFSSYNYKD